jgi:hypothetical protein
MKLQRFLVTLAVLVVAGAIGTALFRNWGDSAKSQALAAVGSLLASLLLVAITWIYVVTNQETLLLLKEQWHQSRSVLMKFGIRIDGARPSIWVANLGQCHFLIESAVFRTPKGRTEAIDSAQVVKAGTTESILVSDELVRRLEITGDVDLSLLYRGPDSINGPDHTPAQAYNFLIVQNVVQSVREGFH